MLKRIIGILLIILIGYIYAPAQEILSSTTTIPTKIVIYRDKRVLAFYSDDSLIKKYKIAVGKSKTPTPKGDFKIINKVKNPAWYPKGKNPVEPGVDNPVGSRWMGLDIKGYGIHGTNVPSSIGKSVSHGCIRMKKKDVEELFSMVDVGTTVVITDSPSNQKQLNPIQVASANLPEPSPNTSPVSPN